MCARSKDENYELSLQQWEEEHAHLGYRYKRRASPHFLDTSQHKTNYHQTLPSIIYLQTHHGKRERAMD